jgi:alpha-amylase
MWLAERVWEPDLARVIAEAGYRYTLLDDTHLRAAGAGDDLGSYYVTDKAGRSLAVFPIDRGLRTRIPFSDLDELVGYMHAARGRTLCYGDDTEKFGLWPTTEKRVWQERWLELFFERLKEEQASLQTVLPSEEMGREPPASLVYIPTISYAEMGAWTLPPDESLRFQQLSKRLALAGFHAELDGFVRGGIWQAFLAKYPESRLIYRKMLRVSEKVEQARRDGHANWQQARDALYRGQCNCAYWHGLFGGLYLQHLRAALMSALIEAEQLIAQTDALEVSVEDADGDLRDEVLIEGPDYDLYIAPGRGGAAYELDLLAPRHHLTGVLARRREAYHVDVSRARVVADDELENVSAHDLVRATEEGLADKLRVDAYPRGAFVDHLLAANAQPDDLEHYQPLERLADARYTRAGVEADPRRVQVVMHCERGDYRLRKTVMAAEGEPLRVRYELEADGERRPVCFASEVDITLLSPETVGGRRIAVEGDDADEAPGARVRHSLAQTVQVAASDMGVDVQLRATPPSELWRMPIETVSQSERGFESAYQGTALVFAWRTEVGGGETTTLELALLPRS